MQKFGSFGGKKINNGNRTERSPIRSVIVQVITKVGRPRSRSVLSNYTGMTRTVQFYYISTEIYSLKSHVVNFRSEISSGQSEERTTFFTCEKNRSSNQKLRTIFFHCIG